jgi:hypothetical protein
MIHKDTFNQIDFNGSKGLVYIGNKILAYRRDNQAPRDPLCVDLPGGGKEGDESPFDTFKREVFEEFGLLINESDIISSYAMPSFIQPEKNSFFFITKNLNVSEGPTISCPVCKEGNIVQKRSRRGIFYACDKYPDCKTAFNSKPTGDMCPDCGQPLVEGKEGPRCSSKGCEYGK